LGSPVAGSGGFVDLHRLVQLRRPVELSPVRGIPFLFELLRVHLLDLVSRSSIASALAAT
jgi:hypothetical protein